MDATKYVVTNEGPGPATYGLDVHMTVRRGRQREVVRTLGIFLLLLVAQWPMRQAAQGEWRSEYDFAAVVPGRLSVMVDVAMIFAYLLLAYRSFGLLRSTRPGMRLLRLNQLGVGLAVVAGVLDLYEDWRLWQLLPERQSEPGSLTVSWADALGFDPGRTTLSGVVLWTAIVGLILVGVTVLLGHKGARDRCATPDVIAPETGGDIICCSGGGIRSAAFSLGGLESLSDAGIYSTARAVLGVSGGGYMGAAYHVARWNPMNGDGEPEWPGRSAPGESPPYGLDSPETGWVRRHTSYVLGSAKVALQAVLSLSFGIAVNLLLLGALIGGLAWVLGWLMLASGRLPGNGSFAQDWSPVAHVWWIPAAGVLMFVARQVTDRWWIPSTRARDLCERTTSMLIFGGGAVTALILGVPFALHALDVFADGNSSVWADLVRALGLSTTKGQVADSSTAKISGATIGTIVSAILAVLASAKSAGKDSGSAQSGFGRLWARVWAKIKDPVVPWTAAATVVLVLLVVLLRWVAALVADPALLESWGRAYLFGGLLLAAKLGTDANRTSLHHFFRERISGAFLVRKVRAGVESIPFHRPLRFSRSSPRDGGPELVACAVANVSDEELVASKRGCVPFVFDQESIGLTDRLLPTAAAQRSSATYEFAADPWYGDATVPAALAMSAAAFSPLAGRENGRLGPYRAVLALANARLGVWLPNPLWVDEVGLFKRLRRFGRDGEAADVLDRLKDAEGGVRPAHPKLSDSAWHAYQALAALNRKVVADQKSVQAAANAVALFRSGLDGVPDAGSSEAVWLEHLQDNVTGAEVELRMSEQAVQKSLATFRTGAIPGWQLVEGVRTVFKKPGITRLAKEALGKASIYDRFLYVTDGGHYDNLGLIEALRRHPKRIFILDASNDKENTFRSLGRAIATARMDLDCEVDLDPRGMRSIGDAPAKAAGCIGTYKYATGEHGEIVLCKAIMLGDLPWDIETYAKENAEFPRTSTNNQLYNEFDFEAYRALGHATMTAMIEEAEDRPSSESSGRSDAPADGEHLAQPAISSPRPGANGHRVPSMREPEPALAVGQGTAG